MPFTQMTDTEYFAFDAINASYLKKLYGGFGSMGASRALVNGKLGHMMLFEPDRVKDEFVVGGPINPRTGKSFGPDTAKFKEWLKENGADREVVTQKEHDAIAQLVKAVRAKPKSSEILGEGEAEVVVVWEEGGRTAKAKLDWLRMDDKASITDLKTTESARKDDFYRDVLYRYHYDLQAAWYIRGVEAVTGERLPFFFIAAEKTTKTPPDGSSPKNMVNVFHCGAGLIAHGDAKVDTALKLADEVSKTGMWPGYSDEVICIDKKEKKDV